LVVSCSVLLGCAPRPTLNSIPDSGDLDTKPVFIATTRQADDHGGFGPEREQTVSYLRYDISYPPNRPAGKIVGFGQTINPDIQFLKVGSAGYSDATAFRQNLSSALKTISPADREVLIYVHGYNNSFDEGVLRLTQLTDDLNMTGVAVHYSWPSAAHPLAYEYDQDSVLFARDGLEDLIAQVHAAGARRVVIAAHSMGGILVVEALRQMDIAHPGSVAKAIDGVVLLSPDIDVEVFKTQLSRIQDVPQPFLLFVSQRDRALSLSGRLTGQRERLGNIRNYSELAGLNLTILDVTQFSIGIGHFALGDSVALLQFVSNLPQLEQAFRSDSSGRSGIMPGMVLVVQNTAELIISSTAHLVQ